MKLFKRITVIIGIFSASLVISCGKDPLLTNIGTNQLVVVLKGTYESNSPMPWSMPDACATTDADGKCTAYTAGHTTYVQDDSVVNCDGSNSGAHGKDDKNPSVFLLDISEASLVDYNGTKYKFANYRQTYAFGMGDWDPFFSGVGYPLENDDAPSKAYGAILLYVRKMLIDGARKYTPDSDGWKSEPIWDVFSEKELPSFNFNKYQMHSFYDTLRYESAYMNRVYPLIITISDLKGMVFSNEFPLTVLEVRIVVKNFIKKYEQTGIKSGVNTATHYYAFSDWLQDVQEDDRVIGGNILTVARSYIPGLVGTIKGTIPSATATPGRHVIAIPHDPTKNNIYEYTAAGNARENNICNLPKSPSLSLSTSISQMLEYYLKTEKYKYEWNQKVPAPCDSFETYKDGWNAFMSDVGSKNFKIPHLAVFASTEPPATGGFTIENVSPGSYDLYIASVPPTYGQLYYDGEFTEYPYNPVTVSIGSCKDSRELPGDTSIDF